MSVDTVLDLVFNWRGRRARRSVPVSKVVVGGWTGKDKKALRHHIDELAKIGVKAPNKVPMFYRVGTSRITTADAIEVIGNGSSGEVEYFILKFDDRLWIGAGSDHTDRAIERMGITIAKQICDKPIARSLWLYDELKMHWEALVLKAHIVEDGRRVLYQEGPVSNLLSPDQLLDQYLDEEGQLENGNLLFGGTCGTIGDVRYSTKFEFELSDPVLSRSIEHKYDIVTVPVRG